MIPHRLAALLPVELDEVAWSCSIVAEHGDGSSTVLVHLARRDQLDAYLAPLRGLSVGVWAAIPEARLLARFLSSVLGESHEERTLLASTGGTHHLLVERKGELLYHRSFAARAERESPQFVSEMLLLSIGEIQGARSEFENQLGRSLPGPIRIVPEIDPAPSLDLLREYAGRLSQKLAAAVVLESAALESSRAPAPFARSLAEIGAFPELSVVPAKEIEALGRREAFRTVLRTALFVALLAGLTVAAAFASLRREEAKTELLRAHVAEAESRVEEIERMREALEAEAAALGTDLELWRVLASVEAALPKSLFIQRLAYQRGDKVQLVGSSAELRTINDFARELEGQPLWKRVDVLRVQRPGRNRDAAYQFEMEGRLDEGAAVSGGAR
jgi:Tfp pilus assembly protein PilN